MLSAAKAVSHQYGSVLGSRGSNGYADDDDDGDGDDDDDDYCCYYCYSSSYS